MRVPLTILRRNRPALQTSVDEWSVQEGAIVWSVDGQKAALAQGEWWAAWEGEDPAWANWVQDQQEHPKLLPFPGRERGPRWLRLRS